MSAYTQVKCSFRDPEALVEGLRELGYKPNVFSIPVQLEDYRGKLRTQRAEIIIPRVQLSGLSNDVGFARQADGTYVAIISEYDQTVFTLDKLEQLKLTCNQARVTKIAKAQGMKLVGEKATVKNGKRNVQYIFEPRQ